MNSEAATRRGIGFGIAAYFCWGLFPLYFPLLEPASALEILAHRMVWSAVFVALILWRTNGWASVRAVVRDRRKRALLGGAATVLAVNWGTYIWGVNSGHVVETSLGYFINPLLMILFGVVLLHEKLRRMQWIAVGVATVAIVVLTVDYGRLPWIALTLAFSFSLYGYFKKRASVGAVESLAVETGFQFVPALIMLGVLGAQGSLTFGHHGSGQAVLLVGTGVVTAVPLLFFGAATRLLPLSVIGLLQYLTPVLQFAVGVLIDNEAMPASRWAGFALVWVALVILTIDGVRPQRKVESAPPARDLVIAAAGE